MRVIICGGREYELTSEDYAWLATLGITQVFHGGARGADACAWRWAQCYGIPYQAFAAHWRQHGVAAGPIRNGHMLAALLHEAVTTGEDVSVIAFPGGKGTADMVSKAKAHGVRVITREVAKEVPCTST